MNIQCKGCILALALSLFIPFLSSADQYPVNPAIDIRHYAFELSLSDSNNVIFGKAHLTVLFKKEGIRELRLDLINATAARQGKGMVVENCWLKGSPLPFTHQNDVLLLQLPQGTALNSTLDFTIQYHGIPFDGLRIGPTRFGDRSFFCEHWPNKARQWLPTLDHPSDKATSEFIVTAPSHYKVVSNGLLLEESDLGNQTRLTHWKQSVPVSCWLFVLGVADFAVKYVDEFQGKSIQTWVYAKNREAGFFDFEEPTKKVLEFYSDYVGPFAYEKLANIQCASVGGGMETSSAIFYAENLVNGKRDERTRNVVIHEIAHQWFGNAVTETTWDDVWLSEGFATFFTLLFIEHAYGAEEFKKGILKARKTVFDLSTKLPNFSIISPRSPEKEEVTSGITYQKGAWVLHMLRHSMGEAAFQKGIRTYYNRYFNGNATTDNFREIMEKASGKKLDVFFRQWLYQPINPSLEAVWSYNPIQKSITIDLTQTQDGILYNLPVEIGYKTKGTGRQKILKMNLTSKSLTQSFKVEGEPEQVELDPDGFLLAKFTISRK